MSRRGVKAVLTGFALSFAASVLLVLGSVEPASACSCIGLPVPLADRVAMADEAVIGTPTTVDWFDGRTDRGMVPRGFRYRVTVAESRKGVVPNVIEVETGTGGGDCGVELTLGNQIGLLIATRDGRRTVSICLRPVAADELRALDLGAPPITGTGPPVFAVVGQFGPAWIGLLDAEARPLAWAASPPVDALYAPARVGVCAEGRRLATVRQGSAGGARVDHVALVDTATLTELWSAEVTKAGDSDEIVGVACAGDEIRLLVNHQSPLTASPLLPNQVIRVTPSSTAVVDRPEVVGLALDPSDGSIIAVEPGTDPSEANVVREDPATGSRTAIGHISLPPDRTVAGVSVHSAGSIAVAMGSLLPEGRRHNVEAVEVLRPDGSVAGRIDPQVPVFTFRSLGWTVDGRVLVLGEGGRFKNGLVVSVRPDGSERFVIDLPTHSTSLTSSGTLYVGHSAAFPFRGNGVLAIDAQGNEHGDIRSGFPADVVALPSGPGSTALTLDPALAGRLGLGPEARVVPVAATVPASPDGPTAPSSLPTETVAQRWATMRSVAIAIVLLLFLLAGAIAWSKRRDSEESRPKP